MSKVEISLSVPRWLLIVVGAIVVAAIGATLAFMVVETRRVETLKAEVAAAELQAEEDKKIEQALVESELLKLKNVSLDCNNALDYPGVFFAVSADGKSATLISPDGWQVKCITYQLKGPSSIYDQVLSTRAIDGTRSASWGNWTATWTYSPGAGVNFIVQHN
jgi:hypothetical protein